MKNFLLYKKDWNVDLSKNTVFLGNFDRQLSAIKNKLIIAETNLEKFQNYLGPHENNIESGKTNLNQTFGDNIPTYENDGSSKCFVAMLSSPYIRPVSLKRVVKVLRDQKIFDNTNQTEIKIFVK